MSRLFFLAVALCSVVLAQAAALPRYEGEPLPGFVLNDTAGNSHSFSGYRGKVLMVNFWATYCGPCIKEIPSMQRLKEKMAGKPFEILAIDMAESKGDVEAFLLRHHITPNFPILLDTEGKVLEQWMISAVPTTFIVDPQGQIRYALYGGLEWDRAEVVETIKGLLP